MFLKCTYIKTSYSQTCKAQKKAAKREQLERQQQELQRIKEIILYQDLLNNMGGEDVRQDFLEGNKGAIVSIHNIPNGQNQFLSHEVLKKKH